MARFVRSWRWISLRSPSSSWRRCLLKKKPAPRNFADDARNPVAGGKARAEPEKEAEGAGAGALDRRQGCAGVVDTKPLQRRRAAKKEAGITAADAPRRRRAPRRQLAQARRRRLKLEVPKARPPRASSPACRWSAAARADERHGEHSTYEEDDDVRYRATGQISLWPRA